MEQKQNDTETPKGALENLKVEFPEAIDIVWARAWKTDEDLGYDRWKADQYSLERGTHDCIMMVFPESTKKNIDYRRLLKECMKSWIEDEGGCWDPDFHDELSAEEKKAVVEIRKELGRG